MTDPRQAPPPADAAMLREIADQSDKIALFRADPSKPTVRAARLRALAEVLEREARQLAHARYVLVAKELLPQLTADWSEPVRVKVEADDGRVLKLVLKSEDKR
jgi:hypothetical protein